MQKPDYIITKRFPCPDCEGSGIEYNPAWEWYWRENKDKDLTPEQDLEWFRDVAGIQAAEYKDLPGEILNCPVCGGAGMVEQDIDLRVALREITAEVEDDFARALEDAEQWRALTRTLRQQNNLDITHFQELFQHLVWK